MAISFPQQLRNHPQLQQAARQREILLRDHHYPSYHFGAPEGRLNDPNGLCRWQGLWHLFYQAFPTEDGPISWGHAVSEDLIHWKDLPYALCPGPEPSCWSGSALVEEDRVIAMYHAPQYGNMVAVSRDPLLLQWEKLTGGAVIPAAQPGENLPYRVYDPCIWKKGEWYYSLSGSSLPHPATGRQTRTEFLFRSQDLIHWEYLHPLFDRDPFGGRPDMDGACPYLWPIGENHERDLLLHFSHLNGGQYMLGNFSAETYKFEVCNGGAFNSGSWIAGGVSAPSAAPDEKGGVIAVFTLNRARYGGDWDQIMSLPCRFTLTGPQKDRLAVSPAGNTDSLRRGHVAHRNILLPANEEILLPDVAGDSMELEAVFAPGRIPVLELTVLRSPGREECTRIAVYRQRGDLNYQWLEKLGWIDSHDTIVSLDATEGSLGGDVMTRPPETGSLFVAPEEPVRLHIFIDKCVVEVFVNDALCLSTRVFPSRLDSRGVSLRAIGQPGRMLSLDAWQMASIYEEG